MRARRQSPARGLTLRGALSASIGATAILAFASIVAQGAPLIALPFLSRRYDPGEFGVYAVFLAVVTTVSIVASGRFEMAIPLPDDDLEAESLLWLSLGILATTSALTLLVVAAPYVLRDVVPFLGSFAHPVALLVAPAVAASGIYQSLSFWGTRQRSFAYLAGSRVALAVLTAAVSLALSYTSLAPFGLELGFVAGQACAALVLFAEYAGGAHVGLLPSLGLLAASARKHAELPRFNVPHTLLDGARDLIMTLLVARLFGVALNGSYAFSVRLLRAPASLAASSVNPVFMEEAGRRHRTGDDVQRLLLKRLGLTALLGGLFFLPVLAAGPWLFTAAFGPEWTQSGMIARILAPWLWAAASLAAVSSIPVIVGRQREAFRWSLADLVSKVVALMLGAWLGGWVLALVLVSLVGTGFAVAIGIWYARIAPRDSRGENRAQRAVFVGVGHWAQVLAEGVDRYADGAATACAIAVDGAGAFLSPRTWRELARADVLVRVGFRPAAQTWRGRAFDAVWRLVDLVNPSARRYVYWIGTDVHNLRHDVESRGSVRMDPRYVHLAGSPRLAESLAQAGVSSTTVNFPLSRHEPPLVVPPFPSEGFTFASYVPDERFAFYGGDQVIEAARRLPDVNFILFGGSGNWASDVPSNVQILGWIDSVDDLFASTDVLGRVVKHDSVGGTVVEALFRARPVVYTMPLEHTTHVDFGDVDGLVAAIERLAQAKRAGTLQLNLSGRQWAKENYDPASGMERLMRALGIVR